MLTPSQTLPFASRADLVRDLATISRRLGKFQPAHPVQIAGELLELHAFLALPPGEASRAADRLLVAELQGLDAAPAPLPDRRLLVLRFTPLAPDAATPDRTLHTQRRFLKAQARAADPDIQSCARRELAALEKPRVRPADLAALRLTLAKSQTPGEKQSVSVAVPESGVVRIPDVGSAAWCWIESVKAAEVPKPAGHFTFVKRPEFVRRRVERPVRPSGTRGEIEPGLRPPAGRRTGSLPGARGLLPQSAEAAPGAEYSLAAHAAVSAPSLPESLSFASDDGRVIATLEAVTAHSCKLKVQTSDPALKGKRIYFNFGAGACGLSTFKPVEQHWEAPAEVPLSLATASQIDPLFEIESVDC